MSRPFLAIVAAVVAGVLMHADDTKADQPDEKIDPARLVGKWKSRADYSISLPVELVGVYEFTKGGEMRFLIASPDDPTTGVKRMEGSYKVNGRKVEIIGKVVEAKEKEKWTMEIVRLTDTILHLKHDDGKVEEFDRVKEKKDK